MHDKGRLWGLTVTIYYRNYSLHILQSIHFKLYLFTIYIPPMRHIYMMIINIQTDAIYTAKNLLNSSNLMPAMPHWMQQQGTPPVRVLKGFVE